MQQLPVLIFGLGGVGRALVQQIVDGRQALAGRNQLRLQVVGVADSRSWQWEPAGLGDEKLQELVARKKARQALGAEIKDGVALVEQAEAAGLEKLVVVDVTAADDMEPVLDAALERGYAVALANKKPLAGSWKEAQRFFQSPRLRYEATVGSGQPVIAALRYLLDTNDAVKEIEGQLSGSLGYICQRMDEGTPFSVALAAAKAHGYTEPDPRVDLSGQDVMRKVLILGRTAGWPLEADDVKVESLYPSALAHLPAEEFMAASLAIDPPMGERVNAAGAAGEVLRYTARLTATGGEVGLAALPMESPLANLKYVSFRSRRYDDEPLLIGGKGAGVEVTAAGVMGDIVALAREAF